MGPSPANYDRQAGDVTVANTTAETALGSYTIGAFTLDGDHAYEMRGHGYYKNNKGSSLTAIFRVKLNGTILWEDDIVVSNLAAEAPFEYNLTIQAAESDAIQVLHGTIILANALSTPTTGRGSLAAVPFSGILNGDATEDATTDLLFEFTVEMNAAHADAYFVNEFTTVDYY